MLFNFIKKTPKHRVKLFSMLFFVITDATSYTITADSPSNDVNLFYSKNINQTPTQAATVPIDREYTTRNKPQESNSSKAPVINLRSQESHTEGLHKSSTINYSPSLALNSFSLEVDSMNDNNDNDNNQEFDELDILSNKVVADPHDNHEEAKRKLYSELNTEKNDILLQLYDKITLLEKEVAHLKESQHNNHERYLDIDQRIMSLHSELHYKDQQKNSSKDNNPEINSASNNEPSILSISDSIYRAQILIQNKQYIQAIDILTKTKNDYPLLIDSLDKNSDLFNVYFWIAEINIHLERYDIALIELKKMENLFKNHNRFPEVLYKIGALYQATGKIQESNNIFKTIVTKYPESSVANIANQILNN
jgi:TolA-binding protein